MTESREFIFQEEFPSIENIGECLLSVTRNHQWDIKLITPKGEIGFGRKWSGGYYIVFPQNCNSYVVRSNASEQKMAKIIYQDIDRLSWMDYQYVEPSPFVGDIPQTLDEVSAYYQDVRKKLRITQEEKDFVLDCFAKQMFEETLRLSSIIEMPFKSLHLHYGSTKIIARTDGKGNIEYNSRCLFHDADTIRQTIIHELCHSETLGHGKRFSTVMESTMMKCGYIDRPCACSPNISTSMPAGARFPIGRYCPGYNFLKGLRGETVQSSCLGKRSIWMKV